MMAARESMCRRAFSLLPPLNPRRLVYAHAAYLVSRVYTIRKVCLGVSPYRSCVFGMHHVC